MKKRQKRKAREISEKRRPRNREYTLVSCFFVLIFVSMIGYLIYFNYAKSDDFINSPYNTRQDTFSDRVVRGKIISADGQVLAQTNVYEDGTEERTYPYANMFAHVVGYDTNGKSGLESEANFQATNGAYPPGSTFKVVTALDYFRTKGSLEGFSYLCEGSITREDHTIRCYGGTVHGQEDFYSAFANSCNSAFAEIGTMLGGSSLKKTAEDLLFNKSLPLSSYKKSTFTLNGKSSVAEVMQTAIGQGNTLVSPMHMALITSAIANGGELMKPYLIDSVVSSDGETVKTTEPENYKRLMTTNEANILGKLMKGVVENGTASALNGRGYTVAGKTGSAEFDENGSSHSWFIGYSNVDDPDLVVAIIVENGGTGSEAAVPIAEQIFDAYYYDKQ